MLKKISAIVIPTVIAAAILGLLLVPVWDDLLTTLSDALIPYLAAALVVCVFSWVLRGVRYQYILRTLGIEKSLTFSTACIFISQTANLIVPARLGDLVRIFILKHEDDTPYSRGFSSIVIERVFDVVMVAVLGIISLPFAFDVPPEFYTILIVPLVGGGVFFLILLLSGRIRSENRYLAIILNILHEIQEASLSARALTVLCLSSLVIWLVDILVCLMVVMMFRQDIPFAIITLAIVIGNLVKAVPLTSGGIGMYEAALTFTFTRLAGTPEVAATVIAIVDHLVKNIVTLLGGIVSIYYFGSWTVDVMKYAFNRTIEKGDDDRD